MCNYDGNQSVCVYSTCNVEQYHGIGEDYQVSQFDKMLIGQVFNYVVCWSDQSILKDNKMNYLFKLHTMLHT